MIYRIEKGEHYAKPKKLALLINKKKLSYSVKFLHSCEYNLNSLDQGDINKLFGIGYFPNHHKHSARFGWRWDLEKKKVEIVVYIYDGGERVILPLGHCTLGVTYTFDLLISGNFYLFGIDGPDLSASTLSYYNHSHIKWIGYLLHPYFGGNKTAPHEMFLELKKL